MLVPRSTGSMHGDDRGDFLAISGSHWAIRCNLVALKVRWGYRGRCEVSPMGSVNVCFPVPGVALRSGVVRLNDRVPRARGGRPDFEAQKTFQQIVFPARAGVGRYEVVLALRRICFPRRRGGRPCGYRDRVQRGAVFPAGAGVGPRVLPALGEGIHWGGGDVSSSEYGARHGDDQGFSLASLASSWQGHTHWSYRWRYEVKAVAVTWFVSPRERGRRMKR